MIGKIIILIKVEVGLSVYLIQTEGIQMQK